MSTPNKSLTPPAGVTAALEALPVRYSFANPRGFRVTQPRDSQPSRTKQEFKNDCDINRIMSKFQRTGALTHFANYSATYGDITALDYQTAQNTLIRARNLFDSLPSSVRKIVSTPAGFLDFVQDPKNAEKLIELGLRPKPVSAPAEPVTPTPPATPTP